MMKLTQLKKTVAFLLVVAMVLPMGALIASADCVGWFADEANFEPIDDTLKLTWVPDAAEKINLLDCSFDDWDELNLPVVTIERHNVVAWINNGYVPEEFMMNAQFAADGAFLYVAFNIVDYDVRFSNPVADPLDPCNLVNYNTGDVFQMQIDFGNKIRWLLENDPDKAEEMTNARAVFYSFGIRGDGEDIYISVQESDDDRILGVGDAVNVDPGRSDIDPWNITDTGTKGKTWLTDDGWAAEFCIPFSEMFYDFCYKSYNEGWNDMIENSITIDEDHPLEIGLGLYNLNWNNPNPEIPYDQGGLAGAYCLHAGDNIDEDSGRPLVTWATEDLATKLVLEYEEGMEFVSPFLLTPEIEGETQPELVDVALNQYAEATFSIEGSGWGAQGLLAGNKSSAQMGANDATGWHYDMSATISAQNAPVITIYLDSVYTIYTIDLYPVNAYNDAYVSVMPQDFTIELSSDGGRTWVTVATETGVVSQVAGMEGHQDNGGLPAINLPYSIVLDEPTDANMMRMTITKGGTGRSSNTALYDPTYGGAYEPFTAIGSIEMLGVFANENESTTVTEPEIRDELTNVALHKPVSVNNGNTIEDYTNNGWGLQALTDGVQGYGGWIGNFYEVYTSEDAPTILTVDLGAAYDLTSVVIKPYDGPAFTAYIMPFAYTVEVYDVNASEWVVVGEETECWAANPSNDSFTGERTPELVYELDETIAASKVRMVITQDSTCDIGVSATLTVVGEIEAYGTLAEGAELPPELVCVSNGATAIVTNGNSIESPNDGWSAAFLTDGDATTAWHGDFANFSGSSLRDKTVLLIDLGAVYEIGAVNVYPYAGSAYSAAIMPSEYTIEAYVNGAWVEVASDSEVFAANGVNCDPSRVPIVEVLTYTFDTVEASQVRMVITADSYCDLGMASCLTVVGEIEVMGYVVEPGDITPENGSTGLRFVSNGDGTCYVSGIGSCTDTDVIIPSVSPIGDIVTSIGYDAFSYCSSLTSIEIPNGVTSIGDEAFYACYSLTSIEIPDSVTSIGDYAFYACYSLTSIEIPDTVTSIGDWAFWECYSLKSIVIPDSVTSIGCGAFAVCSSLTSIEIPDSVTSIGDEAFCYCESLTRIEIPNSVTSIGGAAFSTCSSLTSVTIGNGVTSIGDYVFEGCKSLTSIRYHGTEAQWLAISKGDRWDYAAGNYTITYNYTGGEETETETEPETEPETETETETEPETEFDPTQPYIYVDDALAITGREVKISVYVANNPGVVSMYLNAIFDPDVLTLISVEDAMLLNGAIFKPSLTSPYILTWDDSTASENNMASGKLVTFTFLVNEDAEPGETTVSITYNTGDVINFDLEPVAFATVDGTISIIDYVPGDVNGDGEVDAVDVAVIRRHLAGWPDYAEIHVPAADVNKDGAVNATDVALIRRYLAGWEGVELK